MLLGPHLTMRVISFQDGFHESRYRIVAPAIPICYPYLIEHYYFVDRRVVPMT